MLDLCLLGTGGMLPLPARRLSALLVRAGRSLILLDCGEGTQVALRERGWGLRHLNAILLSHMHADHVLGLPGLLLTLANSGKTADEPLLVCGPPPLEQVLQGLLVVAPQLPYPLKVTVLHGGETIMPPLLGGIEASCVALDHDVPCLAYALRMRRAPRFDAERARELGVPRDRWRYLQHGQAVEVAGRTVEPEQVRGLARRGLRLVYATDTCPTPDLTAFVADGGRGADLLIADGMYGDDQQKPTRWAAQHMTFAEAATLARDGGARRLWLTHYGPGLSDPLAYLERATAIFPATVAGHDGMTESLVFEDKAEPED